MRGTTRSEVDLGLEDRDQSVGEVRRRAAAGTRIGALSQVGRAALGIAVTACLARLLTPNDFGLIAGVIAITALADVVRDAGLSAATVSSRRLTHSQASALFWLNTAAGAGLAGIVMLAAPLIADFYDRPLMQGIALALAVSLLISGLGTQHSALLLRGLQFKRLAAAEVAAVVAGSACAVVAAALGAGYWALVLLHVVTALARTTLVWLVSGWRPGRPCRRTELGDLLGVGGNVLTANVLNYAAHHVDNVIVGRVAGTYALGLYSRAYGLLLAPLQQVNQPASRVAVTTLTKLAGDAEAYRHFYVRMLQGMLLVTVPLVTALIALAPDVLGLLLGAQWVPATDIYRALGVAAVLQLLLSTNGWLYLSSGRTRSQLLFTIWSRPLMVLAFLIGSRWGAVGVAWGYSTVLAVLFFPAVLNATRGTAVRPSDVVATFGLPLATACVALAALLPVRYLLDDFPVAARVLVPAAAATAGVAGLALLWPRLSERYRAILRLLTQAA